MTITRSGEKEDSKRESVSMTGENTKRIRYESKSESCLSDTDASASEDEATCEENEQKCHLIFPSHHKFEDYQKSLKVLSKIPLPTKLDPEDIEAQDALIKTMDLVLKGIAAEYDRFHEHLNHLKEERQKTKNKSRNLAIDVAVTKPSVDTATPRLLHTPGTPNSATTPTSLPRVSSFTNLSFIQNVSKVFAPQTIMEKLNVQIRNSTEKRKIAKAKSDHCGIELNNIDTELKLYEYLKSKLSDYEKLKEPEQILKLAEIIGTLPKTIYEKCGDDCKAFLLKFGPKGKPLDKIPVSRVTLQKK